MREYIFYVSENGKKFDNKKACEEYEEYWKKKNEDKIKFEEEKEKDYKKVEIARKEYEDAYKKYIDISDKYDKKYKYPVLDIFSLDGAMSILFGE